MEETKEQYDKEIAELEKQRDILNSQISTLKQSRAEMLCPHKVRDIITNNKGDRQAKISKITYGYGGYTMFGGWLKKDGSFGTERELYWFEWK